MTRLTLLVVLAAACGPKGGSAAGPLHHEVAPRIPEPGPCPDDTLLEASLTKLWSVAEPQRVKLVSCTPGRFGVEAWLVYAYVDTWGPNDEPDQPGDSVLRRIVLSDGAVVADSEPDFITPYMRYEGTARGGKPVDLTGDGVDEILETEWAIEQGNYREWLDVLVVDGADRKFVPVFHLVTGYDNAGNPCGGEVDCRSKHELTTQADGSRRLVVSSGPACENAGTRTYGYIDGAFRLIP